jgi:hypothetical protein
MSSSNIQPESSGLTTRPRAFEDYPWITGLPLKFGSLADIVEANDDPFGADHETKSLLQVGHSNVKFCQYAHHYHPGIGPKFGLVQPRPLIPRTADA